MRVGYNLLQNQLGLKWPQNQKYMNLLLIGIYQMATLKDIFWKFCQETLWYFFHLQINWFFVLLLIIYLSVGELVQIYKLKFCLHFIYEQ